MLLCYNSKVVKLQLFCFWNQIVRPCCLGAPIIPQEQSVLDAIIRGNLEPFVVASSVCRQWQTTAVCVGLV